MNKSLVPNTVSLIQGNPLINTSYRREFGGGPHQTIREVSQLLLNRDEEWLKGATKQIEAVLAGEAPGLSHDQDRMNGPHLARSIKAPFSLLIETPTETTLFAALETTVRWDSFTPKLKQWERYAALALVLVRRCFAALDAVDTKADSAELVANKLDTAGANGISALQALQIAHSLRNESSGRTDRAKHAAEVRHASREALLDQAIQIARSKPFRTKKDAAVEVVNQLPKDEKGAPYDLNTVLGWFRERGFSPLNTAGKAADLPPRR